MNNDHKACKKANTNKDIGSIKKSQQFQKTLVDRKKPVILTS